jgi:hypothetical protein
MSGQHYSKIELGINIQEFGSVNFQWRVGGGGECMGLSIEIEHPRLAYKNETYINIINHSIL